MNASGILSPSAVNGSEDHERAQLWTETQDRLEQLLPGFLDDLVPTPTPLASSTNPAPVTGDSPTDALPA